MDVRRPTRERTRFHQGAGEVGVGPVEIVGCDFEPQSGPIDPNQRVQITGTFQNSTDIDAQTTLRFTGNGASTDEFAWTFVAGQVTEIQASFTPADELQWPEDENGWLEIGIEVWQAGSIIDTATCGQIAVGDQIPDGNGGGNGGNGGGGGGGIAGIPLPVVLLMLAIAGGAIVYSQRGE